MEAVDISSSAVEVPANVEEGLEKDDVVAFDGVVAFSPKHAARAKATFARNANSETGSCLSVESKDVVSISRQEYLFYSRNANPH